MQAEQFIAKWHPSGGSERSNYQLFLTELCDLLGVEHPDAASPDNRRNAYVFERAIEFDNRDGTTSTKFADLYKRACFLCETKQGVEKRDEEELFSAGEKAAKKKRRTGHGKRGTKAYDNTMRRAVGQAEQYARALSADEGRPVFLMVVDVGYRIELYSEFSQTGGAYVPFPDAQSHRIKLEDLADESVRETLRLVWTDPAALDPSRRSARVTRDIADSLAKLAKALETEHEAEVVAQFLMRCLFTMFAEDIGLLPADGFLTLLRGIKRPEHFVNKVEHLWATMDTGGFSVQLDADLKRFNGGLFKEQTALPLTEDQLALLIEAADKQWNDVEPAIFGTLLERALDPVERHKLGAHYTPRAYVERLVVPTVVEPLREEWDAARVAAMTLAEEGDAKGAADELTAFHDRLCEVRVLDPACGSGNFLYVVLEHLKRIEGEVFDVYDELVGDRQRQVVLETHTVGPEQLLGIEINPRAAAIAELVLWIGHLQWHYRTRGKVEPPEPIIRDLHNIECRDAVLAYDSREPVLDEETGEPVTIWDGRTTKPHPVTGLEVPNEAARKPTYRYVNPRKAEWPTADYVVGNPPYIGARRIRLLLGDAYVESLRVAYKQLPETCDLVMCWWDAAASAVKSKMLKRFGFITTNSIVQSYSRVVIEQHLDNKADFSLCMAIADHPWVDSNDGADVRVAMTVGSNVQTRAALVGIAVDEVQGECRVDWKPVSKIGPFLTEDRGLQEAHGLAANHGMCFQGVVPAGDGFKLCMDELEQLGIQEHSLPPFVRRYFIGRDIVQCAEKRFIIDFFGKTLEQARAASGPLYQRLLDRVYPIRQENKRAVYKEKWWLFAEARPAMRNGLNGLKRFIATPYTAKFRPFVFFDGDFLPDAMAYAIASGDAYVLGVLSTRLHLVWALSSGSRLGVGNDPRYTSKQCFFPFAFPDASDSQQQRIRELGEQLDAHRKARQAEHPKLTMTGMYNVLEKLRAEEPLSDKEKVIHEQGLVSVLRQIHDDLDAAVAEAYGWPVDLTDEEILERLVALNHERAEEEKRGVVRWLRPEYQNPDGVTQKGVPLADDGKPAQKKGKANAKKRPWPAGLAEQAAAVQGALATLAEPADEKGVAALFSRAKKERVGELLATLAAIGKARELEDGRYVAA